MKIPFILSSGTFHPIIAQAGGLVEGASKAMSIVMLIGSIFGTICVIGGGFAIRRGDTDAGKTQRASNTWTHRVRNERFSRYWQAMLNRELRRQKLVLYLSCRIDVSPPVGAAGEILRKHYESILDQLQQEFEQVHEVMTGIFNGQGARITPMTDSDYSLAAQMMRAEKPKQSSGVRI